MKHFNHLSLLAFTLLAGMTLASCVDDEDRAGITPEPTPTPTPAAPSILGEWLDDSSSDGSQLLGTDNFKADGTFDAWLGWVSPTNNMMFDYDGTYTFSDNTLTLKYLSPITGQNTTETYQVNVLDKYSLETYFPTGDATTRYSRIVATYNIEAGQTRTFEAPETGFTATSFTSTNPTVATVDASGRIQAVSRGFAFVKAKSSLGTAVVRVNVTETGKPFTDGMALIGASMDNIDALLGTNYVEVPGDPISERTYNVMDDVVESIVVSHFMGSAVMTTVKLREGFDQNAITSYLDAHYTETNASSVGKQYQTVKDDVKYKIFWLWHDATITYMPDYTNPDPEPVDLPSEAFEAVDGLILYNTINDVCKAIGYELTDENLEEGNTDDIGIAENAAFESMSFIFDNDVDSDEYLQVGTVILRCQRGITQADIEPWYAAHYEATGDELNPYYRGGDKPYWVSFKESGSRLLVYYRTSKRRK